MSTSIITLDKRQTGKLINTPAQTKEEILSLVTETKTFSQVDLIQLIIGL